MNVVIEAICEAIVLAAFVTSFLVWAAVAGGTL